MKLILREGQDIADSYKNAIIASRIAFRHWRDKFLTQWTKNGGSSSVMINGEKYIGGSYQMDRVDNDDEKAMAELLNIDDASIDEFNDFMNQDGVQDIDLRFYPKFCASEYCIAEYLKILYDNIYEATSTGGGTYSDFAVISIDLPSGSYNENGPTEVYVPSEHRDVSDMNKPILKDSILAMLYILEITTHIFSDNGFITTETRTAQYHYSDALGDDVADYTYEVMIFAFKSDSMPTFLKLGTTASTVHTALYHGDSIDNYTMIDYFYEYIIFEYISYHLQQDTDHTTMIDDRYYIKESWLRELSRDDFMSILSLNIQIYTSSESSWPWKGTFIGDVIDGFKGLLIAFTLGIEQIDKLPIISGFYYTVYYALQIIGLSEQDLDNFEIAYRKIRTQVLLLVLTLGIGNTVEATATTTVETVAPELLLDQTTYSALTYTTSVANGGTALGASYAGTAGLSTAEMLGDAVSVGMDIYNEINTEDYSEQIVEDEVEDKQKDLEVVQDADEFDSFYAMMLPDYSELTLDDYSPELDIADNYTAL